MGSAYRAAEKFNRAYLSALKAVAKEKRAVSGGQRLPKDEHHSTRWKAKDIAQEQIGKSGGAIVEDDTTRSPRHGYIAATDKFMSGWGHARRKSYYVVAVDSQEEADIVLANMGHRSEMKRARWTPMLPEVRPGDHMRIVDKRKAERFFNPPHEGGFGQPTRKPLPRANPIIQKAMESRGTGKWGQKVSSKMKLSRVDELREAAANAGLHVSTYSPGDGQTRYRFHEKAASYFADSGVHTALGLKAAWKFLQT
jgi:hypothetical protein